MAALDRIYVGGDILLYGDVGDPWGFGDGFTPSDVAQALAAHGPGEVTVRLNSGGGIAWDGVAIHSLLKAHPSAVNVVIDGLAASAASLIAMAGERIEMRDGAMMMIHDASGVTFGTAADHDKSRAVLDKLSDQYAGLYAARSGRSDGEIREMMLAETWLTAAEAVEAGLATAVIATASAPAASFDYRLYAHAPASLPRRARPEPAPAAVAAIETTPAAPAALQKETQMSVRPNTAEPTPSAEASAPVKDWAARFYASAEKSNLPLAALNAIAQEAPSLDVALARMVDAMAARDNADKPSPRPAAVITEDERDRFVAGVSQAMLAQGGVEKRDPKNEFNGITPMKLAEMSVVRAGAKAGFDRKKIVATAITHTSSDFPLITQNIAEKAMLRGYEEQEETFNLWTSTGTLSDFKQGRRVGINALPSLPPVNEAGEFQHVSTGERGEPVQLGTFGEIVTVTRQLIINDDLGVFVALPRALGRAARRTVGDAVYGVLTSNPNMADGVALFQAANHRNNGTGAPSALQVSSLITAVTAMATQPDRSNPQTALNISPRWLIVPKALQPLAKQLMESTAEPGAVNAGTANRVAQLATVISDGRLDRASTTAWYLAANQNAADTIEVQYLDGVETPFIEQAEEFDVDGMKFKVRIDFGVKALQWEGLYRAVGA